MLLLFVSNLTSSKSDKPVSPLFIFTHMSESNLSMQPKIGIPIVQQFDVHNFHFFGQLLLELSGLPRGGKEGINSRRIN